MNNFINIRVLVFSLILLLTTNQMIAQKSIDKEGKIYGYINLDESWDSKIYLSYIPSFNDLYLLSPTTIISDATIDKFGYFSIDISFLPEEENLFRLHVVKKGDSPNSLIIGGKNENHTFIIANGYSKIEINVQRSSNPPFKKIKVNGSQSNTSLLRIKNTVSVMDSLILKSNSVKSEFIKNQFNIELLHVADTSSNPLVSLYALHNADHKSIFDGKTDFFISFLKKWENQKNTYFEAFRNDLSKLPQETQKKNEVAGASYLPIILFVSIALFISIGFLIWKRLKNPSVNLNSLSVQERKILAFLKNGATNQEISEDFNIEISTVKSHVSNIFKKLNVKSRKDLMSSDG